MSESEHLLNAHQRKKAARKKRQHTEREAHRSLDSATGEAIALALEFAPQVAASTTEERVLDVELGSVSEANFVRKRVNDALNVGEWLDVVSVWVWEADRHNRAPLSEAGQTRGFEVRLEGRRSL